MEKINALKKGWVTKLVWLGLAAEGCRLLTSII